MVKPNTMARNRDKKNKGLPANVYFFNGYYKYRRPDIGKFFNIGKDRIKAIQAGNQLNAALMTEEDSFEKVLSDSPKFATYIEKYETEILPKKKLKVKTRDGYKNQLQQIKKRLGNKIIDEISVKDIADFLDNIPAVYSNHIRSLLTNVFRHAVAEGLCEQNVAEKTIPKVTEKLRGRLSFEAYQAIYDHEDVEPWFKNAMDIALQSLQRREDIVEMKFADIVDDHLFVVQQKTEKHGECAYLKIKIDKPFKEVINRCRDGILCPYLIHRYPSRKTKQNLNAKSKKHPAQITPDYLTKTFSKIRDKLKIFQDMPVEERPTFHEIRSLGIMLYEKHGIDAQALAGHTTREMTEKYKEGHEIQWTEVEAGLDLELCTFKKQA